MNPVALKYSWVIPTPLYPIYKHHVGLKWVLLTLGCSDCSGELAELRGKLTNRMRSAREKELTDNIVPSQMGRDKFWAATEKWHAGILWLDKAYGILHSVICATLFFSEIIKSSWRR